MSDPSCWGIFRERTHSPGRESDDSRDPAADRPRSSRRAGSRSTLKSPDEIGAPGDARPRGGVHDVRGARRSSRQLAAWRCAGSRTSTARAPCSNTYRERMIAQFAEAGVPFIQSRARVDRRRAGRARPLPAVGEARRRAQHAGRRRHLRRERRRLRRPRSARWPRAASRARSSSPTSRATSSSSTASAPARRRRRAAVVPVVLPQGSERRRPSARSRGSSAAPGAAGRRRRSGLEVYGGDAIVTAAGELVLLDLNAWPSFALYRDEAAARHRRAPRAALRRGGPRVSSAARVGPRSRADRRRRSSATSRPGSSRFAQYAGLAMARGARLAPSSTRTATSTSTSSPASASAASATAIRTTWRRSSSRWSGSPSAASPPRRAPSSSSCSPASPRRGSRASSSSRAAPRRWRRRSGWPRRRTGKHEVLGFWGGFHGKTGGVLGLLGSEFKHHLGPFLPGQYLSPYADCYRCPLQPALSRVRHRLRGLRARRHPLPDGRRDRGDHRRADPGHGRQRHPARRASCARSRPSPRTTTRS